MVRAWGYSERNPLNQDRIPAPQTQHRSGLHRHLPTASPAVAGFRPAAAAVAVAAAFAASAASVSAQPVGPQVIQGQATFARQGNNLVVTTQNGAGTRHSAINWQSFSVPAGSFTRFNQPGATSTSINRVVGGDPSAIFGTLSSNGKLVLVNQAGITVGTGAVVDTAAFTASTLRMTDSDAVAGRLVFGGDGLGSAGLQADGSIVARRGDVVLIAPNVQVGTEAFIRSPNGSTLLAAGRKVAMTGRGLEGIRLELQAPADQAVNLGTLQGDAVGIFAGQLRHSGLIQATAVSGEGGKVLLMGVESADVQGTVTAVNGVKGGQVHVSAGKVRLRSGAVIDVSAPEGRGEALIGGGWQGKDARLVNASETLVEAGATVHADASDAGNGGTIVAWSDRATRVYGNLSARGGAKGGDGGQIETSGHYLDMQGTVDARAPRGRIGSLLLDPTDIFIADNAPNAGLLTSVIPLTPPTPSPTPTPVTFQPTGALGQSLLLTSTLQSALANSSVTVMTANATAGATGTGSITVVNPVTWSSNSSLTLLADDRILINAAVSSKAGGILSLRAQNGITQSAPITAPQLLAVSAAGNVTLTNTGNSVGTIAGSAGPGSVFSLTTSGSLVIGAVTDSASTVSGVGGPSSNNVTLKALAGAVTQTAALTGNFVTIEAFDQIQLTGSNAITNFSAMQTSPSGFGGIALVNTTAFPWGLGAVTQATTAPSTISIRSFGQDVMVNGLVQSGPLSTLLLAAGTGALVSAGGQLKSDTITLQANSTGAIGTSAAPIKTASNSGTASLYIGTGLTSPLAAVSVVPAAPGVSGVFIANADNLIVASMNIAPGGATPVSLSALQALNLDGAITGASSVALAAGGNVTVNASVTGTSLAIDSGNLVGGIGVASKVYDGTTDAVLTGPATVAGLVLTPLSNLSIILPAIATFGDRNAGIAKTVTAKPLLVTGFNGAATGSLLNTGVAVKPTTTADITPRPLDLTGSKTFDATATFAGASISGANVLAGDTVTLSGSATVSSSAAGNYTSFASNSLVSANPNYTVTGGSVIAAILAAAGTTPAPASTTVPAPPATSPPTPVLTPAPTPTQTPAPASAVATALPGDDVALNSKIADALKEMEGKVVSFGNLLVLEGDDPSKVRKNSKIVITVTESLCKPS